MKKTQITKKQMDIIDANFNSRKLMKISREFKKFFTLLTVKQTQALFLCHHDFGGMTQGVVAKKLGISQAAVHYLLISAEKALPQFFPIITEQEAKIYHYYMVEGWSVADIAEYMEKSERMVRYTLQRARKKEMYYAPPKGRVLSLDKFMEDYGQGWDEQVKQKF